MSPLYLHCGLCGRKQADGLLSRGHWGHIMFTDGKGMSACPTCKERHPDWEERLRAPEEPSSVFGAGYGGSYRSAP